MSRWWWWVFILVAAVVLAIALNNIAFGLQYRQAQAQQASSTEVEAVPDSVAPSAVCSKIVKPTLFGRYAVEICRVEYKDATCFVGMSTGNLSCVPR